ncbi:MAG: carbonate dehydratase [Bacteroidetes bacterium]|nr:carbonate dehydratase [Bacteroidota bacterium]
MSKSAKDLLAGNLIWVEQTNKLKPGFFNELAQNQSPEFLWIGCSDSRVPASDITNTMPGAIFVQRNIANMVIHTDANLLSVVNYAVKILKVKHIIVCGHYGCGGVSAAMSNQNFGFLDNWLMHIKDVYRLHEDELDAIEDDQQRFDRYVELNIIEQVHNLSKVSFIQEEWHTGEYPYIHGWVYSLENGRIKDLNVTVNNSQKLDDIYRYKPRKKS